jgi:hypothetical protein
MHPDPSRKKWLPDYPAPRPGEWVKYDHGMNSRGWYLDCGSFFHADVYWNAGRYCLTLNMHPVAKDIDPEALKREAERHIVARVRLMIPAYKAIHARAKAY